MMLFVCLRLKDVPVYCALNSQEVQGYNLQIRNEEQDSRRWFEYDWISAFLCRNPAALTQLTPSEEESSW